MFIKIYIVALSLFLAIDFLWLGIIAKNIYKEQIGFLMKSNVNFIAAFIFYLLFISGLVFFVLSPAIEKGSWQTALLYGAFFGLITYATYDLTNLAIINNWPLSITLLDMAWGMTITALTSLSTFLIVTKFL